MKLTGAWISGTASTEPTRLFAAASTPWLCGLRRKASTLSSNRSKQNLTPQQEQQVINQYADLKAYVDAANQRVDLDHVLRAAVIKAKIWGKAGFEIEFDPNTKGPSRLVSLPMLSLFDLRPHVDEDWKLQGYWWRGQIDFYKPNEILYFVNNALESDYEGLSDIEPILDDLETGARFARKI